MIRIKISEIGVWEFGQCTPGLWRTSTGAHVAVQIFFVKKENFGFFFKYDFCMFADGWFLDAHISCNMLYYELELLFLC